MSDSLSYPIGKFVRQSSYTAEARASHIARLAAQPAALASAVEGWSEEQLERRYRPGGWTVRQLLHHVADSHMNMFIRLKLALSEDAPTIKPYDQDAWVLQGDVAAVAPAVSLALLEALHVRIVALLSSLSPAEFSRTLLHPESGEMTVDQLVALYAWHGDHHIAHVRNTTH
ncbi:MAG: putative metal-dependent hydrolase [Gemmatimonadaceae bacterium]|nr:putative metal-dependent hydrolase [Gemmatimonadaceae bacterium]